MKSPQIVDIEAPEVIEQEPEVPVKKKNTKKVVKSKVENVFPFGDCLVPDVPKPEVSEFDNSKNALDYLKTKARKGEAIKLIEKFETSELVFKDKDLDMTISNNLPAILKAKKLLEVYEEELRPDIPVDIPIEKLNVTPKIYKPSVKSQCPSCYNSDCTPENCDCDCHLFVHGEPKVPVPMPMPMPKKPSIIKYLWTLLPFVKKLKAPEQKLEVPVVEEKKSIDGEVILTLCPLCKNELSKSWIRQEGENFKQKMICKDCKFEKEYIFSI